MKRLTPAALTLMMFGVVGLLVVAYIAKSLLAVESKPEGPAMRNVPMAIADIEPGTVITENHLGQGPFPVDKLTRDTLLVNRVVVGRVAKEAITAAQPIHANQLYKPGELPPLEVGPGMRAISIEIGDSVGIVDGLIKPGQFVDLLFTYTGSGDERLNGGITLRICQGVRLIAINRNMSQGRPDRNSNRITLELSEAQASVVTLAKDRGIITLAYNPAGQGNGTIPLDSADRVTLYEILGMRVEQPSVPFITETYRGANHDQLEFSDKGRRVTRIAPPGSQRPNYVLPDRGAPNSPSPPNTPAAPAYDNDRAPGVERTVPGPQDVPATRSPTASRPSPLQN